MNHEHAAMALNWWTWDPHRTPMGWFFVDFAAFLLLLAYFTAKPLRNALSERHHHVRRAVTQAAAAHAKATSEQQLWANKVAGLDHEVRELEQKSRVDGELEVARMVADAEGRASQARSDAALQAEQELRRAHEAVREQVLREVLQRARILVTQAITQEDQKELIVAAATSLPAPPHPKQRGKSQQGDVL